MGLGLLLKYFKAALIKLNWLNFKTKEEDNIMKKMILIVVSLLLFGVTVFNQALAAKSEKVLTWSVQPSEAYDAIAFIYAMALDNQKFDYGYFRENWKDRLKEDGLNLTDAVCGKFDICDIAFLLHYARVETLDDIIKIFSNFPKYEVVIKKELLKDDPRQELLYRWNSFTTMKENNKLLLNCFLKLKEIKFDQYWRAKVKPVLVSQAKVLRQKLKEGELLNQQKIICKIDNKIVNNKIYVSYFSNVVVFQISRGAMVMPGSWEDMNTNKILQINIHESLHGFSKSGLVVCEVEKIYQSSMKFKAQYDRQLVRSGFEEPFVVALTAYISETLGYATYEENEACINNYQGGMPLALEVYQALRKEKPELKKDWQGYGAWLLKKIEAKEFVSFN